jgi:hypothetical protein
MPIKIRQLAVLLAVALPAGVLGGCSTINTSLTGTGEALPAWLGGMPSDVPPRRGTPEYDAFMKEQERKRLEPAPPKADAAQAQSPAQGQSPAQAQSPPTGLAPVH